MYINPVIRYDISNCRNTRPVFQIQVRNQNTDCHIITIGKSCCNSCRIFRNIIHSSNKIFDRHGADYQISLHRHFFSILFIGDSGNMILFIFMNPGHFCICQDCSAKFTYFLCSHIPEFSGSELRIGKFFYQRSFNFTIFITELFAECIFYNSHNGNTLYALCAPGWIDLAGMTSPQIFCIMFKKHGIKLFTKTIDIKIFKRIFLSLENTCSDIAETGNHGCSQSHVLKGLYLQRNRIIIKFTIKEDTGYTISAQHDPICFLRIRSTLMHLHWSFQNNIIIGRCTLLGKHLFPPFIYFRYF